MLLGPTATAVKQSLFSAFPQFGFYAPLALWLVSHKDENFICLSYGVTGMAVLFFAWSGWVLTRRRPGTEL